MYSKGVLELAYRLREVLKSNKPLYERAWEIYVSYIMSYGKYGALSEIAKRLYPVLYSFNKQRAIDRAYHLIRYKVSKLLSRYNDSLASLDEKQFFSNSTAAEPLVEEKIYPGLTGKMLFKRDGFRTLAELLKISYATLKEFGLQGKLLYHAQSIVEKIIKEKGPELTAKYPHKTWFKKDYVKISKQHTAFIYAACLKAIGRTLKTNHNSPPKLKAVITAPTGVGDKELNEARYEA